MLHIQVFNVGKKVTSLYALSDFLAAGRPTEIPEKDIYLNEARYDEEEGQFRKLKGLKVY